jgi:PIN domain nuclease of toxin-antitoxin system
VSIKKALGKLEAPDDVAGALRVHDFEPLPITIDHAQMAGALPRHHDDPFDRMLVAQGMIEDLTIVTHDRRFAEYGVDVLDA